MYYFLYREKKIGYAIECSFQKITDRIGGDVVKVFKSFTLNNTQNQQIT